MTGRRSRVSRRRFLEAGLTLCGSAAASPVLATGRLLTQAPAIVRSEASRPVLPQGVGSGDAATHGAVVWSRTDRPARMFVEYSTTDRFTDVRRVRGPAALASSDYTARLLLAHLPPGQRIFYRVTFQDLSDLHTWSDPVIGSFRSPSSGGDGRGVRLAWSADTVGQGWGINPDWGGLRLYETILRVEPDLFIHCGDTIYADGPLQPEVTLEDGTIWKNVVTEAKSKVAETVDDFRGNYKYNLLDEHMRRFNAEVPQIVIWDDHEVRDNWYDTRDLSTDERYRVKSAALLAARGRQAFFEFNPLPLHGPDPERIHRTVPYGDLVEVFALDLRSYRGANSENRQRVLIEAARLFGASQMQRLKAALAASRATWKVIASDLPIGLVVRDGPAFYEAIANGNDGPPLGRELEVAELLRFVRDDGIRNLVWVTGDVHHCAAHHYDPARARFTEFSPFWEFVAGPLHAGTFGPNTLDATFGPEVRF
ncbi:MAG: alkaline phosphatase D family protein, partial [Chloroflexota bacterium]|nr:alkaline phosphatase D family protein [Chloroflexota bacterium]